MVVYHDGRRVQKCQNGTVLEVYPDGLKIQTNPDGVKIESRPDGSTMQTNPNGMTLETLPVQEQPIKLGDETHVCRIRCEFRGILQLV